MVVDYKQDDLKLAVGLAAFSVDKNYYDILFKFDKDVKRWGILGLDDFYFQGEKSRVPSLKNSLSFDFFTDLTYFDDQLGSKVQAHFFSSIVDAEDKSSLENLVGGRWMDFYDFDERRLTNFALKFCQEYYKHISKADYISKERLEKYSGYPKKV